jgi:exopolysaccharide production protein ExoQ
MLTYDQSRFADRFDARSPAVNASERLLGLQFWMPAIVFTAVLFVVQHDLKYASSAFASGELEGDLVADVGSSTASRQLGFLTLAALGAALLLRSSPAPLAINGRILCWLGALVAWGMLSALWADDVALSLKRLMPPLFTLIAACGVAKTWQPRQLCWFAFAMTGAYLLLGVAAECATGAFLYGDNYRFSGTLHPNDQGVNCALLCLASLCLYRQASGEESVRANRLWLLPFFVGGIFLVLTASRTATVSCAAGLMTFWSLKASGLQRLLAWGGIALVAMFAGVVWLDAEANSADAFSNMASMGREQEEGEVSSLSGRVPIWSEVMGDIAAAPLTGYGYGAFWTPQRVLFYSYVRGWEFTHAHSAYFETLLNIGAIGLALGLFVVFASRRTAIHWFREESDPDSRFVAAVLTMALVHGLLDSNFVREGLASTIALLCVATMMFHYGRRDAA